MPRASLCTSLVFLKIPACLYNSTMHSGAFFISLVVRILSSINQQEKSLVPGRNTQHKPDQTKKKKEGNIQSFQVFISDKCTAIAYNLPVDLRLLGVQSPLFHLDGPVIFPNWSLFCKLSKRKSSLLYKLDKKICS